MIIFPSSLRLAAYGSAAKPKISLCGKPRLNLAIDSGSDLSKIRITHRDEGRIAHGVFSEEKHKEKIKPYILDSRNRKLGK